MTVDPFSPGKLGPITLKNRIIKAATFEGMSIGSKVTPELIGFHRKVAAGGAAMTTLSYVAVSRDAMGAPHELTVRDSSMPGLVTIASEVHKAGALLSAQLGHAGAVGQMPGKLSVGPSAGRSMMGAKYQAITRAQMDQVVADFVRSAVGLADAGLDCIELHLGHGYLLSSFMSPKLNKRTDDYGGSVENRARFPREVVKAVKDAVGARVALTAKMNFADSKRSGLQPTESLQIAKMLEADGCLDAFEFSGGSSLADPMYIFHGDRPMTEFATILPPKMKWPFKLFGGLVLKKYPWSETYFLPTALDFRRELTTPMVLLGGVTQRATLDKAMADGVEFVAMGRALLREPDLINKWQAGSTQGSTCIHCNKCMVSIYTGTRCVIDQPEPIVFSRPTA